ncbi:unnamed protein product [marine sediment metagenome]|uniref:Uncharacterized protein n=1 Tax=marine sediment metagenome TaxID=412755 RepID=X1BWR6_9ZZZZ
MGTVRVEDIYQTKNPIDEQTYLEQQIKGIEKQRNALYTKLQIMKMRLKKVEKEIKEKKKDDEEEEK